MRVLGLGLPHSPQGKTPSKLGGSEKSPSPNPFLMPGEQESGLVTLCVLGCVPSGARQKFSLRQRTRVCWKHDRKPQYSPISLSTKPQAALTQLSSTWWQDSGFWSQLAGLLYPGLPPASC